jgi:hypothetical protein
LNRPTRSVLKSSSRSADDLPKCQHARTAVARAPFRDRQTLNRSHTLITVAIVWTAAIFLGVWITSSYGTAQPEELLHVPTTWPPGIHLDRDPDRLTLLLVLHPDCDCARKALASLRDILGRSVNRLALRIVFTPNGKHTPESIEQSDTWLDAHDIAGAAAVSLDRDGQSVRQFGFRKSAHALLYDRTGLLLFSGGITPPTHAADATAASGTDNPGANAVLLFVLAGAAPTTHAPVPGCPLTPAD